MTHNVNPYAHRLGILRDWKSRWFSKSGDYQKNLKSDVLLREYLAKYFKGMLVSAINIERDAKTLKITVSSSRPGLIIGRGGDGSVKLKKDVEKFIAKHRLAAPGEIKITIEEVKSPESDASLVAQMVVEGLEKRMPYRRVMKQTIEKVMANRDVKGVKISMAGLLGGSDMGRKEGLKRGRIPLQTFRSDIDYASVQAHTSQGAIGVKVWIYKGDVFDDKPVKMNV